MPPDWIARAARSERLAAHAGFWWGCAEGVFFFIVPDVYISFATLFSLRAGATAWAWSIGGSVTAVCVIYLLSAGLVDYVAFLESVPGISSALIADVRGRLATAGLPVTPWLVLEGVPLKVYGGLGFGLGMSLGQVLLWSVFARIVRIAPTFALAAGLHLALRRRIAARPGTSLALLLLGWAVCYTFYFVRLSRF